jgi:hypothetical protein
VPAWVKSHDDQTIWSMVALLQKLPGVTSDQYKKIATKAPPDKDMGPMKGKTMQDPHANAWAGEYSNGNA